MKLIKITLLLISLTFSSASFADQQNNRPDYHAPIGVMGDHVHQKGEIMLSYRLGYMYMDENINNRDHITEQEVLDNYMMAPTSMSMKMHMFGLMYGLNDKLTLAMMGGFADKKMDHINRNNETFIMDNDGFTDTKLTALYRFYDHNSNHLQFNTGISIPTASIKDNKPDDSRFAYPMQMGSGTYDILPTISYSGFSDNYSWGTQLNATFRLGRNNSGYTLGDIYNLTFWGAKKLNNLFSLSLRIDGKIIEGIEGKDHNINPMTMGMMAGSYMGAPKDPTLHNKKQIDSLIGLNFTSPFKSFKDHRLAIEFGMPIYQRISGPMLETDYKLMLGWQKTF